MIDHHVKVLGETTFAVIVVLLLFSVLYVLQTATKIVSRIIFNSRVKQHKIKFKHTQADNSLPYIKSNNIEGRKEDPSGRERKGREKILKDFNWKEGEMLRF